MIFMLGGAIINIVCWKLGIWKDWRKYYPTILFFIIGNLTCELLFYHKPLWEYGDIFGQYTFLIISIMLFVFPGTTILFLSFYPQKLSLQILYIFSWSIIFEIIEAISVLFGIFTYHEGWSLYYSFAHDFIMFALLRVHFKKPLLAWPIAVILACAVVFFFRIPLEMLR